MSKLKNQVGQTFEGLLRGPRNHLTRKKNYILLLYIYI